MASNEYPNRTRGLLLSNRGRFFLLGHVSGLGMAVGLYMIMGRWGRAAKARANE